MGETLLVGVRVVVSLAIVLLLLWYLARRLGAGPTTARRVPVTVLGRQSLNRHAGVTVVEVGGRTLLLGVSDNGVSLLTELDTPPVALEGEPDGGGPRTLPAPRTRAEARARRTGATADDRGSAGALAGSVVAPGTWRTTWDVLRGRGRP